jgi:hypothetical protein
MFTTWLIFQLAGIGASVVLAATEAIEEVCTCPGGAQATTCPMHHGAGSRGSAAHHATDSSPADAAKRCAVNSTNPPTDLALLALAGGAGVLPHAVVIDDTVQICGRASLFSTNPSFRTELPDSPPPRA